MKHYKLILLIGVVALIVSGCATETPRLKLDPSLAKDVKRFGGEQYVELTGVCSVYGLNYEWDKFLNKAVISRGSGRIVVRAGSDRILAAGKEKRLDSPAVLDSGELFVPLSFVRKDLACIVGEARQAEAPGSEALPKKYAIRKIVLDAGHGGRDAGAIGRKLRLVEKDMTLSIAKRLKSMLEAEGISIIMTRSGNAFVPLSKRADIANKSGADLFVSIHVNASRSRRLKGFECYYLADNIDDFALALKACDSAPLKIEGLSTAVRSRNLSATMWDMIFSENRRESADLSSKICESIESSITVSSRGVKSARFYVLKYTRIPAVLVEMGYISNRYEEMKMKDPKFLDRITLAVARGILSYKREYEETDGFTRDVPG